MPYITSVEKIGIQKGREQGLQKGLQKGLKKGLKKGLQESLLSVLESRFQSVPEALREQIHGIRSRATLDALVRQASTVESVESFQKAVHDTSGSCGK